jgi:hypothetical protein
MIQSFGIFDGDSTGLCAMVGPYVCEKSNINKPILHHDKVTYLDLDSGFQVHEHTM